VVRLNHSFDRFFFSSYLFSLPPLSRLLENKAVFVAISGIGGDIWHPDLHDGPTVRLSHPLTIPVPSPPFFYRAMRRFVAERAWGATVIDPIFNVLDAAVDHRRLA